METRFTKKMAYNVDDMRSLYNELHSGHWFDADSMRFFKSRILDDFRRINDRTALFISSERREPEPRLYTVRKAKLVVIDDDGRMKMQIDTIGPFYELTKAQARKLLKSYVGDDWKEQPVPEKLIADLK